MKVFSNKGVSAGLYNLLEVFCLNNKLDLPVITDYDEVNDRINFVDWIRALNEVNEQYQKPCLVLELGKMVKISHLGVLAYISSSCNTLGEALLFFIKYHKLSYDFMDMAVTMDRDQLIISWDFDPYLHCGSLVDEIGIAILFNIIKTLVYPNDFKLSGLHFVNPYPDHISLYEQYFNCPVSFEKSKTKFIIPTSELALVINKSDPVLIRILEKQAKILINNLPNDNALDEQVQKYIIRSIQQGKANIEYISKKIGMAPRVLQRKLSAQGINFKEILNSVRHRLSMQYLENPELSVMEISLLLGYTEQTSFNRAFKGWTGKTPLQWRKDFLKDNKR